MIDYTGVPCPICGKAFHEGDDIVVCPICGTPYHRACYEKEGRCLFEDKHKEGYVFHREPEPGKSAPENDSARTKTCPRCGNKNYTDALFCDKCGLPLAQNSSTPPPGYPFGGAPGNNSNGGPNMNSMPGMFIMDPMGGVNPEEDFNGVKAGNLAKFVGSNPPYYMNVFKRLKDHNIGKFNFCGFLFSGGWLLYRKQYLWGAVISLILLGCLLGSSMINLFHNYDILNQVIAAAGLSEATGLFYSMQDSMKLMEQIMLLPVLDQILLFLPTVLSLLQWIIMFVIGFRGNRMYYKHCLKKAGEIQQAHPTDPELTSALKEKGGINWGLGICLLVCYLIISYFPLLISGGIL